MIGFALEIVLIVAIVALIVTVIQLRDKVEVLEAVVDRLDKERGSAARASK
jgi:hypothetical protein